MDRTRRTKTRRRRLDGDGGLGLVLGDGMLKLGPDALLYGNRNVEAAFLKQRGLVWLLVRLDVRLEEWGG